MTASQATDSYLFKREIDGHRIAVSAINMPSQELYSVWVKVDGALINSFHSAADDVWTDALSAMNDALDTLAEPAVMITEQIANVVHVDFLAAAGC